RAPLSINPGDPGFSATLNVLAHELGHQWLARVHYRNGAGQDSPDLLGQAAAPWSYLLDSKASVMFGAAWGPTGDGACTAPPVEQIYSPLDLYLMGFLDPSKVPPFTLLRNPAVDPTQLPKEGAVVTATPETVAVGQVIAADGQRVPSVAQSQKAFRLGFIF